MRPGKLYPVGAIQAGGIVFVKFLSNAVRMKLFYTCCLMLALVTTAGAATSVDIFESLTAAVKTGNAREISRHFNSSVEMTLLEDENVYSRVQAEMILKEFFSENRPIDFRIIHQGKSAKGCQYAIGELTTTNGTYRTYFFIKDINGAEYIQELRFERSK